MTKGRGEGEPRAVGKRPEGPLGATGKSFWDEGKYKVTKTLTIK